MKLYSQGGREMELKGENEPVIEPVICKKILSEKEWDIISMALTKVKDERVIQIFYQEKIGSKIYLFQRGIE